MTTPLLSPAALTSLRGLLAGAYPDTCLVQRRTPTDDGSGGETDTWPTVATVGCRLLPQGPRPVIGPIGGQEAKESFETIVFPALTDVRPDDRVTTSGRTFAVRDAGPRSWEVAQRVQAVELQ